MTNKGIGVLLIFVLLSAVLVIIYQFGVTSLASTDIGAQTAVAGTSYQSAYNASVNTSITVTKFQPYMLYLIGFFALIIGLVVLIGIVKKKS